MANTSTDGLTVLFRKRDIFGPQAGHSQLFAVGYGLQLGCYRDKAYAAASL
jgi:hypothetical protein